MDGCDGIRATRAQLIQVIAVPTGVVLLASLGWAVFLVAERRHVLT